MLLKPGAGRDAKCHKTKAISQEGRYNCLTEMGQNIHRVDHTGADSVKDRLRILKKGGKQCTCTSQKSASRIRPALAVNGPGKMII